MEPEGGLSDIPTRHKLESLRYLPVADGLERGGAPLLPEVNECITRGERARSSEHESRGSGRGCGRITGGRLLVASAGTVFIGSVLSSVLFLALGRIPAHCLPVIVQPERFRAGPAGTVVPDDGPD